MARNRALTLRARATLGGALDLEVDAPAPDTMIGSMVAIPLPAAGPLSGATIGSSPLDTDPLQRRLYDEFAVEVPIVAWPVPAAESGSAARRLIRVSSALHNGPEDAERLAAALRAIESGVLVGSSTASHGGDAVASDAVPRRAVGADPAR
jgi:hypothetical protein